MAKKIVRGITDVKTINNQDFDTNNVNDLLSDGQYNYIHRKKGKNEEYHNLTDNIKTLFSDNTELLAVTNHNKTTNTATLSPKHDAQKEQVLESTRNTISIHHGTNGTAEKTTVDTNPKKVLEHENLVSDSEFITLDHQTDVNKTHIKTDALKQQLLQLYETISSIGGGTTSTIEFYPDAGNTQYRAFKQVVTNGNDTFVTFTFNCNPQSGLQMNITGDLKNDLENFVSADETVSNGGISIKNEGTTMKLINSAYSEELGHHQQGTFTFYEETGGGGTPS